MNKSELAKMETEITVLAEKNEYIGASLDNTFKSDQ